jgi:hypothetical protein
LIYIIRNSEIPYLIIEEDVYFENWLIYL